MTSAAEGFGALLAASKVPRIAFLGLAKNVGKTTALMEGLAQMSTLGIAAGATSAGRDGEELDALTGERKPPFRLRRGQLAASADSCFAACAADCELVRSFPFRTRFGAIEIRRFRQDGDLEVIGPTRTSELGQISRALEEAGAQRVLVDGAFGRRAFASARVAGAIVLSVGMSAAETLEGVLDSAHSAVELLRLAAPPPDSTARVIAGALTDAVLAENPSRAGETLVAEDPASIFLSARERQRLLRQGVRLAVAHPVRLLAVTANPTAPRRLPLRAQDFFAALSEALPGVALFDLRANLTTGL